MSIRKNLKLNSFESKITVLVLFCVTVLWASITLWNFNLPGFQTDEANHYAFVPGILSEDASRLHHYRLPDNYFDGLDGQYQYPVLGGSVYNSVVTAYLSLPYFQITEMSVGSARVFTSFLALTSILLALILIGRIFGWPVSLVAGLILLTDPSHVMLARSQGASIWPVVLFFGIAANVLLSIARGNANSIFIFVTGFSIGLSAASYFIGLFFCFPLILAGLWILRQNIRFLLLFVVSGVLGYLPVLYGIASIYIENPEILSGFGVPDWAAHESYAVLNGENWRRFLFLLYSGLVRFQFAQGVTGSFATSFSEIRLAAIALSAVLIVLQFVKPHLSDTKQKVNAYLLFFGILFSYFLMMFSLKASSFHHLLPVSIVVGLACASLISLNRYYRWFGYSICAILLVSNLTSLHSAHERLAETGGRGYHNESYSKLPFVLTENMPDYHPVFADWGFHLQFLFLTNGEVEYDFIGRPDIDAIHSLLGEHDRVAIVTQARNSEVIENAYIVDKKLTFNQRDGVELFSIHLLSMDQQVHSAQ